MDLLIPVLFSRPTIGARVSLRQTSLGKSHQNVRHVYVSAHDHAFGDFDHFAGALGRLVLRLKEIQIGLRFAKPVRAGEVAEWLKARPC